MATPLIEPTTTMPLNTTTMIIMWPYKPNGRLLFVDKKKREQREESESMNEGMIMHVSLIALHESE
jgi:hypothetical protein